MARATILGMRTSRVKGVFHDFSEGFAGCGTLRMPCARRVRYPFRAMLIDSLSSHLLAAPSLRPVLDKLAAGADAALAVAGSVRPFAVASLFARRPRPVAVVVSGAEAAERFARDLAAWIGISRVALLPERTDMPWSPAAPDLSVVGARVKAAGLLAAGRPVVVVASARALLRYVAPPETRLFSPISISCDEGAVDAGTGEPLSYEGLAARLVERGYVRAEAADGPGLFAVHGDAVDVYGAGDSAPVRVEFFGDAVDGLRRTVASTGQTIRALDAVEIWPAREFSISKTGLARMRRELAPRMALDSDAAAALEAFAEGRPAADMERHVPALYNKMACPLACAHPDTLTVLVEPRSLFDDASRRRDEISAMADAAKVKPAEAERLFSSPAALDFGPGQRLTLLSLMRAGGQVDAELAVTRPSLQGSTDKLLSCLREHVAARDFTLFTAADRRVREDMELLFGDAGLSFRECIEGDKAALETGVLNIGDVDVPAGFLIGDAHLAVVSIDDLSGRSTAHGASRRRARRIDVTETSFPFAPGDYVVHANHGIALFSEFVRREVAGVERDYMLLSYAENDKLYVPVEQIDRITRYVGPGASAPRLTRLHTADWTRATAKARKSARKLAFDLVDLYARRSTAKGFSYSSDTVWQEEMERLFPYTETPDQLAAIADVKADMESERPMDRLICGDVGFGKTEVALRAAFKAVADGRQVMVLCPTTILAQQHHTTFSERFSPFGARVEVLSRFRSKAQQKAALEGFSDGSVNVLVGTHRLLSRDVNPKELGLVVIDEEQRFGVGHKEQLKNLRESVDVLTLSATPIPRTLQMSLSGVRDMSLITTPPPNRMPVKVHVGEWDADVVSSAIRLEMERGGQAYYVSNRVRSIDDAVARVASAAPEARVGVAHGQMSAAQVQDVMERFSAGEIDVLVATTIVESGLDNPHTNTLIIEDSQRLGLAQLYQLKGRVGRSERQAFAYFLFPASRPLSDEACARLTAVGELTELGSGMKVAMRDLEIRGAGSLLGAEQSGQMSAVGFDLFANMLSEAVASARSGEEADARHGGGARGKAGRGRARGEGGSRGDGAGDGLSSADVCVDLAADFYLPEEFVEAADERVAWYRRLAAAEDEAQVEELAQALREAHGGLPQPAANMVARARVKARAASCGIERIVQTGGKLRISPVGADFAGRVSRDVDAKAALDAMRAIWSPREKTYIVPVAQGEPALGMADAALSALARARP